LHVPIEPSSTHDQNADQIAYWNGPGGQRWAARQQSQDVVLAPVSDVLIDRAKAKAGERILDVGCGAGATSFALAQKVGSTGRVLGIDVSSPMLTRAREVAPKGVPVDFILADATVYPFEPAAFDLLASRFGVMFFAQPALSFANLRKALKPSGRLAFACWREPRDNPFFMAPLQAVYKHVPKLPQPGPDDPGPFSFASEARVNRVLGEAGFSGIKMERCDLSLDIAVGKGLDAAVESALEIGPASRALAEQPDDVRAAARKSMREALAAFAKGQTVPLPASIWIVTASR
jgi:SAM-dependent methyltransferase